MWQHCRILPFLQLLKTPSCIDQLKSSQTHSWPLCQSQNPGWIFMHVFQCTHTFRGDSSFLLFPLFSDEVDKEKSIWMGATNARVNPDRYRKKNEWIFVAGRAKIWRPIRQLEKRGKEKVLLCLSVYLSVDWWKKRSIKGLPNRARANSDVMKEEIWHRIRHDRSRLKRTLLLLVHLENSWHCQLGWPSG